MKACLKHVRKGGRYLACWTLYLCQNAAELDEKGVVLSVLDQNIDTNDATGCLLFNILGTTSQFETEIRAERQVEGERDRGAFRPKKEAPARASRSRSAETFRKKPLGTFVEAQHLPVVAPTQALIRSQVCLFLPVFPPCSNPILMIAIQNPMRAWRSPSPPEY
jgi:hypothetical protein